MTATDVPDEVQRFVHAINEGDTDAFIAAFADDGFIDDWGRVLRGSDGIRSWADTDAIGMGAHMEILRLESDVADGGGADRESIRVRFSWRSRRFSGESDGIFTLAGGRIAGFRILPHA